MTRCVVEALLEFNNGVVKYRKRGLSLRAEWPRPRDGVAALLRRLSANGSRKGEVAVPWLPEMLLYLFLPKACREHVPGDLEEEFWTVVAPKFGPGYARAWYWLQVARSVWPLLWGRMMKLATFGSMVGLFSRLFGG